MKAAKKKPRRAKPAAPLRADPAPTAELPKPAVAHAKLPNQPVKFLP